jgi:hypothetical protein
MMDGMHVIQTNEVRNVLTRVDGVNMQMQLKDLI